MGGGATDGAMPGRGKAGEPVASGGIVFGALAAGAVAREVVGAVAGSITRSAVETGMLCSGHCCTGCVPSINCSTSLRGHESPASCPLSMQILAETMPDGCANGFASLYCRIAAARFMNSAQMGRAECAPSRSNSRLSSKPHPNHAEQLGGKAGEPSVVRRTGLSRRRQIESVR